MWVYVSLCMCVCVSVCLGYLGQEEESGTRDERVLAVAASNEFINTKDEDEEKWQTKARMLQ